MENRGTDMMRLQLNDTGQMPPNMYTAAIEPARQYTFWHSFYLNI